ncbi:MAG TPA: proton-conducting transporter membrane subunit [Candidatus Binatia bacterium]
MKRAGFFLRGDCQKQYGPTQTPIALPAPKIFPEIMLPYYLLIILLAPLLAGIAVGLLGSRANVKLANLGVAAEVLAFFVSVLLFIEIVTDGPRVANSPWSMSNVPFAFFLDRLSAVMLVHIAAISILIHLFSIRYMQQETGYARFHSLLAFTTFSLFGMVTSGNLLMLLMFWQLLSWLLPNLSYNYQHPPTVRGAFRTFIMQRFGDTAFLAAVVLAYAWFGTLDLQQLFNHAASADTLISLWRGGATIRSSTIVTLLIFIGAMAKSAQVPLHMWLPDSLYAPTPVHALLHAGIINAGGFLLARLAPLFDLNPVTLHIVFIVGLLTTVLGSSMMLVQSDIKKTLGYSTIGQMGFMIMECGVGAYGLAIFHLIAHGIFKGTIFLNCGYVIHAARQEPRLPPNRQSAVSDEFSSLTWLTGFATTLILPLIIVLAAHGIVDIPLRNAQGAAIFLFFGWATSSQAILTLYRLRAVASWKVAASMLGVLLVVLVTYLLAAENFSHFLFPAPGQVAAHFRAGALPGPAFDLLISGFALIIVFGWYLIYARSHGQKVWAPGWIQTLHLRLYLFFLNRLYLDALSMRVGGFLRTAVSRLSANQAFPWIVGGIALVVAFLLTGPPPRMAPAHLGLILVAVLLLPLFPFHGIYVTALTRAPGLLPVVLDLLLPAAGVYALHTALPQTPNALLSAGGILALFGAVYGSLKALGQNRMTDVLAYAGSTALSVAWWHLAGTGSLDIHTIVYSATVSLLIAALLLACKRAELVAGEVTLDRMHGLARPMPRLATIVALLVMGAVGLPPFALSSAVIAILLHAAVASIIGLIVILFCWFLASWYLFRMMQRALFGPHRVGVAYRDLRGVELAFFTALLLVLAFVGIRGSQLEPQQFEKVRTIAGGILSWQK